MEEEAQTIFTHVHPAWKDKADYIFRCKIATNDARDEWEQMWGKVVGENTFIVCCIPFFLYGLSIGDKVIIDGAEEFEIIEKSANTTIRIWTGDANPDVIEDIVSNALILCDYAERHSNHLIAFSVERRGYSNMIDFLDKKAASAGLAYEIAEDRP